MLIVLAAAASASPAAGAPPGADALPQSPPASAKDVEPDPTLDTSLVMFPGGIIWQTRLPAPPAFTPAFDGDCAYVILEDGTLVALSVITGAVVWSVPESATQPPGAGHGTVAGVGEDAVWARDATSGAQLWRAGLDRRPALPPLVTRSGIVVAAVDGTLACFRTADGAQTWRLDLGGTPTVLAPGVDGILLAGVADGRVVAVSADRGSQAWTRSLRGRVLTITAVDRRVYVGSDDNFLYVLDAKKGGQEWKWRTGGDPTGAVAVTDKRLSYASLDSMLRTHNRGNGHLVWKRGIPSRPVGGPVILHDRLVEADVAFDLRAYRLTDGSPVGSYSVGDRIMHPPRLAPEVPGVPARLILMTAGGEFTALGRGVDGAIVPMIDLPGVEVLAERPVDWMWDPPIAPLLGILAVLLPPDALFPPDLRFSDPPLRPLGIIPGRTVPPEVLLPLRLRITDPPLVPLLVIPGRTVPPEVLPGAARR